MKQAVAEAAEPYGGAVRIDKLTIKNYRFFAGGRYPENIPIGDRIGASMSSRFRNANAEGESRAASARTLHPLVRNSYSEKGQ
jgi:hypothetical protein